MNWWDFQDKDGDTNDEDVESLRGKAISGGMFLLKPTLELDAAFNG